MEKVMDKAARRSWVVLGIIFVVFMVGLFLVSFWGGPYQSDSFWQQKEPPSFPG